MKCFIICAIALAALALLSSSEPSPPIKPIPGGMSGDAITTRYWDCCKPACCWRENIKTSKMIPVRSCTIDGHTTIDAEIETGCRREDKPSSYMCTDQQPWQINATLSYGFIAASFSGAEDYSKCCSCMLLEFQGKLLGKKLLAQITNSGEPLEHNQFDISMPGGGVGLYNMGCVQQFNTSDDGWGDRITGVANKAECRTLPPVLQPGCNWRFDFLEGIDNPDAKFYEVECPQELLHITGCLL